MLPVPRDLNQHHILMCPRDVAVVEFNRMHLGMQMEDLYHFMRKAMEKHDWSLKLGTSMLETYSRILPLSDTDRTCLYYLFLYPENTGNRLISTTMPTKHGSGQK